MEQAERIGADFAKAFVAAQSEMKAAEKDRKNPHFGNDYATLDSVLDACREVLNKHGIGVMQFPCGDSADMAAVTTTLVHTSGQSASGKLSLPVSKKDPQGHGSAITYARRYGLLAICGLKTGDDDDGNNASKKPEPPAAKPKSSTAPTILAGAGKGKALAQASDAELTAYHSYAAGVLNDPNKSDAHGKALAALKATEAEMVSRVAQQTRGAA